MTTEATTTPPPQNVTTPAAESWVAMLADLPHIGTTATADTGTYSYKYASLPAILDKIRPVLNKYGWAMTQDVATENGLPCVRTMFTHDSGMVRSVGPLSMPAGNNAQQIGSAITYARRYALVAALGLAPDGDDDGAQATGEAPRTRPVDHVWAILAGLEPVDTKTVFDGLWAGISDGDPADMDAGQAAQLLANYGSRNATDE